jgi:hypothetical protein
MTRFPNPNYHYLNRNKRIQLAMNSLKLLNRINDGIKRQQIMI